MDPYAYRIHAVRDRIRVLLENRRQRIHEEIRTYPTPIPRCDQQFNHLIEERELLSAELARLAAEGSDPPASDGSARLEQFIAWSACLDARAKLQLKAALNEGLAEAEQFVKRA